MSEQFVNFAVVTLSALCHIGDTTISVTNAPALPSTGTFRLLIDNELMLVTGVSGSVLTVERGIENTTAAAHGIGENVLPVDTAGQAYQLKYDAATFWTRDIDFVKGMQSGTVNAYTIIGGFAVDFSVFPATLGTLTRTVKFVATIANTSGATQANVRLYNSVDGAVISGSSLNNSGAPSQAALFDVSATVNIGTSPGTLRSDVVDQYEVQLEMVGGSVGTDTAFCTNARLVVSYA